MTPYPKRLIEVDLPIARISAHARREKSIRHGHISTLHIWWARRPLAACRAVILASLWPDPVDLTEWLRLVEAGGDGESPAAVGDTSMGPQVPAPQGEELKPGEGVWIRPRRFLDEARRQMRRWATAGYAKAMDGRLDEQSAKRLVQVQHDAALLDDPEFLRTLLLDFLADFANWDNSTDKDFLDISRALVQAAHEALGGEPGSRPMVIDPFAGGGSIPLEALRVGADAFASDLNPIPVLLNKVVLEYIPRYGQRLADEVRRWGQWVKEEAERELAPFYPRDKDGSTPIAYLWARTILSEAPGQGDIPIEVPLMRSLWLAKKAGRRRALRWVRDDKGKVKAQTVEVAYVEDGQRVVKRVKRPLLEIFEPKKDSEVEGGTVARGHATCPVTGYTTKVDRVREQLKSRRGGAADARLFAVVTTRATEQGRFYRLPTKEDQAAFDAAAAELERREEEDGTSRSRKGRRDVGGAVGGGEGVEWEQGRRRSLVPDEPLDMRGIRHTWAMIYGLERWGDLFSPRQALALTTLARLVREAGERLKRGECAPVGGSEGITSVVRAGTSVPKAVSETTEEGSSKTEMPAAGSAVGSADPSEAASGRGNGDLSGLSPDSECDRADNNAGAVDAGLAEAVQTCLSLTVGRQADILSSLARWHTTRDIVNATFGRQAIGMVWDFAEANFASGASGSFDGALEWVVKVIQANVTSGDRTGHVEQASATSHPLPDDAAAAFVTDPPYYDAVPYAYLSDFFYVWMRRTLADVHPSLFRDGGVPKDNEIVVDRPHQLSKSTKDIVFYERELTRAFAEGRRVLAPSGVGTIVFASKTTASWEAILKAVIDAGFTITGSWPIDTEMETRVAAQGQARLGSSVHLVVRPREGSDGAVVTGDTGEWREVLAALPRKVNEWMPRLAAEGVVGADAIFACLGPALEIFSRFSRVEKASGEEVTLREYLEHVWAAVSNEALSMIFKDADAAGLEPDARLTAMWLWTIGGGMPKTNGAAADGDAEDEAGTEDGEDDEDEGGKKAKAGGGGGFVLEYDAARKIAQGLGIHLEKSADIVEVKADNARLLPASERTRYLFGKEAPEEAARGRGRKKKAKQGGLFEELEAAEAQAEEGNGRFGGGLAAPRPGATALDQVHQAMILFAAGRGEALKRFLVEDGVGQNGRFWKLAQSLAALYPAGTDERRWVEGVLGRKKGLGL